MAASIAIDRDITCVGPPQGAKVVGCEFILYRYLPRLVELLNIETLRVYLRAEAFLSDDDMEKLIPHPPHYVGSQIIETLVKLIKGKGKRGLDKFLSALRKSVDAGYQPGHEELLEILEKDYLSTEQSTEILPLEEVSSDSPGLKYPLRLNEAWEKCDDGEKLLDIECHPDPEEGDQRRRKCSQWLNSMRWCCNNDSKVFKGIMITLTIICLGIGVPQLTIGGMVAGNAFHCELENITPYHIFVGSFLVALGLLLFSILMWGAVRRSLSNTNKCLYNIYVYTLAILVLVMILSLFISYIGGMILLFFAAVDVFSTITLITADHCNLVSYYWALVEIITLLLLIGLVMLFGLFALICKIVKCLK